MALGRRCDNGCASWPDFDKYVKCPICGERTSRYTNLQPLTYEEALEREFEVFYAGHCEKLRLPLDGELPLTPEESLFWDGKYPDGKPV